MSALVSETAERFGPAMDLNGKDLEVDVSNEKLMVFSDKEAVTKILSNLFNNALKYASKNIRVVLKESEGIVAVSVSSDGTKITEKERNLIFEPFYQSEGNAEKKNGVGIGLPLARQLAAVLGGNLVLDNDDSLLNTFTFTFTGVMPRKKIFQWQMRIKTIMCLMRNPIRPSFAAAATMYWLWKTTSLYVTFSETSYRKISLLTLRAMGSLPWINLKSQGWISWLRT